ncbi:ATPase with chaperone activity, ATP-binding subunit [Rothia mucilaginosa DY-18]|uniref:ATPase with chaperone activity, ATP-binding subunit n=1 Tax=Rothia mucilaginosa (strain DY-18) TaxID=680646 RepID=D2NPR7_ROTMD|nr:ATPase with chaperone activity, ATP-binding subunit [Rothia mucilaginosa DY-18]
MRQGVNLLRSIRNQRAQRVVGVLNTDADEGVSDLREHSAHDAAGEVQNQQGANVRNQVAHHNLEGVHTHVACSLHEVAVDEGLRHCTNNTGATHPAEGNQHCREQNPGGDALLNLLTNLTVNQNCQNQQRGNHDQGLEDEQHNLVNPATEVRHHTTVNCGDEHSGQTDDHTNLERGPDGLRHHGEHVITRDGGTEPVLGRGAFTQRHVVNVVGLVLGQVLTEQTEQTHADEHAQTEDCSLVTQEAAQNNNALVDDLEVTVLLYHRYGGSCSYLAHEILTRGSTMVVAISAMIAPTANSAEPYARVTVAAFTSCAEMESIDHLPIPGHAKTVSAKNAPAKIIGIWYAMDCATGMKETRSAWRVIAWLRVKPLARAVRTKSAFTLSSRY